DLVAQIRHLVVRRDREVAALQTGLVPLVAAVLGLVAVGVPHRLVGVDAVEAGVHAGLEAHVVEDVELGLGGEERGVGDAGGLQVLLGLGRDRAGIAGVGLVRERIHDR